jgi:hypothetical protein
VTVSTGTGLAAARAAAGAPLRAAGIAAGAAVVLAIGMAAGVSALGALAMVALALLAARYAPEVFLVLYIAAGPFASTDYAAAFPVSPTSLAIYGALAAVVVQLWLRRGEPVRVPWAVGAYLLLGALLLVGALYSPSPDAALSKALRFETVTAVGFLAPILLLRDRAGFRRLMVLLVALGILVGALAQETGHEARPLVLPGSENEIDVGLLTGIGLVALIAYLWPATPGLWRALWLAPAGFLLWRLVGAGSRGALLGALIAIAVALALQLWRARTRGPALALLAVLVALAPIAWTSSSPDARAKYTAVLQLSDAGPAAALDAGGGERSEIAGAATRIFLDHPMGVGSAGYEALSGWDRPHNIVLELGSELGVAGVAAFLLLIAGVATAVLPQVRRGGAAGEAVAATALVVLPLTVAFSSFDLNDNRMLWLCLGIALSVPQIARSARR